jgi:hypothetical protein
VRVIVEIQVKSSNPDNESRRKLVEEEEEDEYDRTGEYDIRLGVRAFPWFRGTSLYFLTPSPFAF